MSRRHSYLRREGYVFIGVEQLVS